MKTKVFIEEYNGNEQFKIFEVDDQDKKVVEFCRKTGEKKERKPMFNFGIKKAIELSNHKDELEIFVKENK